jgi:hypothetical protein
MTAFAVVPAHADPSTSEHMMQAKFDAHGHGPGGGGGGPVNLVDNGGAILPNANLYAIWWGPDSAWPANDTKTHMGDFFSGMNKSAYLATANQYMRGGKAQTSFAGSYDDTTTPLPHKPMSAAMLGTEVQHVLSVNNLTVDTNAIYFVFTATMANGGGFCAWHDSTPVNGQRVAVAYMPNITGIAGCDPGNQYDTTNYSETTRALANVTAHEMMEAITDALPGFATAWIDPSGGEIGDKCAWKFTSGVSLGGSGLWQLQEEWSNAVSDCVQTS